MIVNSWLIIDEVAKREFERIAGGTVGVADSYHCLADADADFAIPDRTADARTSSVGRRQKPCGHRPQRLRRTLCSHVRHRQQTHCPELFDRGDHFGWELGHRTIDQV